MSEPGTTLPPDCKKCPVRDCWLVRGMAYAGMPPCFQGWAGDPAAQKEYLRGCLFKESS